MNPDARAKAQNVKLAVFDIDGVLTDGGLLLGENGSEIKQFHVHDGLGLVLLMEAGIEIAVITARESGAVASRMQSLGVRHIYQGSKDKLTALTELLEKLGLAAEEASFTGDDLVDLAAMQRAGLSVAVADAHPQVREIADMITLRAGGRGAVREVCDFILTAQDRYEQAASRYTGGR